MINKGMAAIFSTFLIVIVSMFSAASMAEDEMTIKPGRYEILSSKRTSIDNALSKKTTERCIQGNTITPESLLPDRKNCVIKNLKRKGNSSSFDMECNTPGGQSLKGHMEYNTKETSFKYKFNMKGPYEDGVLEIDASGSAVRVGDC
jgi:hypothetical protein